MPSRVRDSIPERVAPTQRDGSQSEISHTFPVPAVCTGPIPVELLSWKFVEGRKIDLQRNAGLELPSNIGELGDSVTEIDLREHGLRGVCYAAPALRDGSESEISHAFLVPAVCRSDPRVDRAPDEPADTQPAVSSPRVQIWGSF